MVFWTAEASFGRTTRAKAISFKDPATNIRAELEKLLKAPAK